MYDFLDKLIFLTIAGRLVYLLLKSGSSKDVKNKRGETPLDCATNIKVFYYIFILICLETSSNRSGIIGYTLILYDYINNNNNNNFNLSLNPSFIDALTPCFPI